MWTKDEVGENRVVIANTLFISAVSMLLIDHLHITRHIGFSLYCLSFVLPFISENYLTNGNHV